MVARSEGESTPAPTRGTRAAGRPSSLPWRAGDTLGWTVVNVAYPFAPVSRDAVGGAEQVLAMLDQGLVARGHTSIVIALEGSRCAGTLVPIPRVRGPIDDAARARARRATREALREVLARLQVDVVHFHGLDFDEYLPETEVPLLATLHLPPEWYRLPEGVRLVAVSESQRRRCPRPDQVQLVQNGISLSTLRPGADKREHFVALARICPEKGLHLAVEAARRAGKRLTIAGQVFDYPEHQRYFREELLPRLDEDRVLIGPVTMEQKRALLAGARALLVPSLAPETSSLAAMEALACGTPVIAFPSGALPELVAPGRTGFLVSDVEEMAAALPLAEQLSLEACRTDAERRFCSERMVDRYTQVYRELARARTARRTRWTEQVLDLAGLEHLEQEWAELFEACPDAAPFQSPDWLLPWCRRFGAGAARAVVIRRDGRLAALLVGVERRRGGAWELSLAGGEVTDYPDALVRPQAQKGGAQRLLEAIARGRWSKVVLERLRPHSPLLAPGAPELGVEHEEVERAPAVDLPERAEDLEGLWSSSFLRSLRQAWRTAAAAGLRIAQPGEGEIGEAMAELFELHARRWGRRGQPGVLADEAVRRFHLEVAAGFARKGKLRLFVASLPAGPIAVLYGFGHGSTCYYYLSGFDPRHAALSPGWLVIHEAMRDAVARRCRTFDFLRGREPYKYRCGAIDRPLCRRVLRPAGAPEARGDQGAEVRMVPAPPTSQ